MKEVGKRRKQIEGAIKSHNCVNYYKFDDEKTAEYKCFWTSVLRGERKGISVK